MDAHEELKSFIRDVPDFPKKGILFRDITPALIDPAAFSLICDLLYKRYHDAGIDKIVSIESRGFIFASVLAFRLGKGFVPLRKPGKLPWKTVCESYELEYGRSTLEMHSDAVEPGDRVLVIDDLLATGGTAAAAVKLVENRGGTVDEIAFVIELGALKGREKLKGRAIFSLISY